MQTFLPDPDFLKSAQILDYRRCGKERVEAWQILKGDFPNHPACLMWKNYRPALVQYGLTICREWVRRGYKDTMIPRFLEFEKELCLPLKQQGRPIEMPWWLGGQIHSNHRARLLTKILNTILNLTGKNYLRKLIIGLQMTIDDKIQIMISQMLFREKLGSGSFAEWGMISNYGKEIINQALTRQLITFEITKFSENYTDKVYQLLPLEWRYGWTTDGRWDRSFFALTEACLLGCHPPNNSITSPTIRKPTFWNQLISTIKSFFRRNRAQ